MAALATIAIIKVIQSVGSPFNRDIVIATLVARLLDVAT